MSLFEILLGTIIICLCTAFGFVWGAMIANAKQEDERNDQQRMAAKHGND